MENFRLALPIIDLSIKRHVNFNFIWKILKWLSCKQNCEFCFRFLCIKRYYSEQFKSETKFKDFLLLLEKCVTTGNWSSWSWKIAKFKNSNILTVFLNNTRKYLESEKLLLILSDIKVYFSRISSILSKTFLKKAITIFNVQLPSSFRGSVRQIKRQA